jgi:ABC-type glutathione transport system ATPase component
MPAELLRCEGLSLDIGSARILCEIDLAIGQGEAVGLVGESGSGKSMLARTILGIQPGQARLRGHLRFEGRDLAGLGERDYRDLRGRRLGYVPQDPAAAFNPMRRIGPQIGEPALFHRQASGPMSPDAAQLLAMVGLPEPGRRARQHPHELSGGMLQRALIASAISLHPSLLVADEPTTALDVTTQASIIELLRRMQQELGMALLLISHDLALVSTICERIVVLLRGEVVEEGTTSHLLREPRHAYTRALLAATPSLA